jgi:two-component sensor histidine kinase
MNFEEYTMRLLPLFLQLVGLTFAVLIDPYIGRKYRRGMLMIIALIFTLTAQNLIEYMLSDHIPLPRLRILVSMYGYIIRPVILALFFTIVVQDKKHLFVWSLTIINAIIFSTAIFSDICFTISKDNHFYRGTLGYSCHIVSGILILQLLFVTLKELRHDKKIENSIPIINVFIIVTAVLLDLFIPMKVTVTSYLTVAIVSCTVFYYIWLHLMFERKHAKALQAEQRMQIMMSQIQPHFLYNTLSTIQALCKMDPDKAFDTTEKFGTYLRQNIDSLSKSTMISIDKEVEHTQIYAEIEATRFPHIHVDFDVDCSDFTIPALTIQPLVENSIRHGVRIRKDGRVSVTVRNKGAGHEIVIKDNGKGFDVSNIGKMEGTHIGLTNVKERVESQCGGTFTVNSVLNEGTTITMFIPEKIDIIPQL